MQRGILCTLIRCKGYQTCHNVTIWVRKTSTPGPRGAKPQPHSPLAVLLLCNKDTQLCDIWLCSMKRSSLVRALGGRFCHLRTDSFSCSTSIHIPRLGSISAFYFGLDGISGRGLTVQPDSKSFLSSHLSDAIAKLPLLRLLRLSFTVTGQCINKQ